jgi:UDPglucose 6-dehydrogenase
MRLTVVGLGYVGLVTATCLARLGQTVVGLERDRSKIDALSRGKVPYFEPHLADDLRTQTAAGNVRFTDDPEEALRETEVVILCVGTPSDASGHADLGDVLAATETIGRVIDQEPIVALRSTVPVGTTRLVETLLNQFRASRSLRPIPVVANPEFLRTGQAIEDFLHPTRIVIGLTGLADQPAQATLATLYAPLQAPFVVMKAESAELVKNASNAFLATRVSFVNELAALCDATGASIDDVVAGMALDPRIGGQFMRPGLGYGGSCLPKDVRSLMATAADHGLMAPLVRSVDQVNRSQVGNVSDRIEALLERPLEGARVAVLGLAFKPDTDDIRESPAIALATELHARGAVVAACDPEAGARSSAVAPWLEIADGPATAARDADAVVLATEWPEYVTLDLHALAQVMRGALVVDARNSLDREQVGAAGLRYVGIGRGDAGSVAADRGHPRRRGGPRADGPPQGTNP